jgi:uncharacterized protein YkwD
MRQLHSVLLTLATALLVGGLLVAAPTEAASAPPPAERVGPATKYQRQAFRATNRKREARDIRALGRNRCVQEWAVRQARKMANQQRMFHQDSGPVMRACGLSWYGENVAMGYPTGRAVVRGWMHSRGHRENILRRQYRLMGLAARKGDDGRWYAAQVFGRKG